jgi:3-hydroxyisobutyrate dehydrogenase
VSRIGFVGVGIMGRPMALNLIKAGHSLKVFNRTPSKLKPLTDAGAQAAATPADAAVGSEAIITMVSDTPDVEQVVLGDSGILQKASRGSVVVDMSTISPSATARMAKQCEARGVEMLDAPVSGGERGAVEGTLSIMVGGHEGIFRRCLPIFQAMGRNVVYCGDHGTGQTTKLCNQVVCVLNILAVCEGLALAQRSGLDLDAMLRAVSGGAAGSWMLSNLAPKMIQGNWAPGFLIRLQQKDLRLVMQAADELKLSLPGTALVHQLFDSAESRGWGEEGTQAMFKVIQALNGAGSG